MRLLSCLVLIGALANSHCASGAVQSSAVQSRSMQSRTVDLRGLQGMETGGRFVLRRETEDSAWWEANREQRLSWDALDALLENSRSSGAAEFDWVDEGVRWKPDTPADAPARRLLEAIVADAQADPPLEILLVSGVVDEHLRVVPRERWEQADTELRKGGHEVLRSLSLAVVPGGTTSARQESSETMTLDWEIELSHASAIHAPLTRPYARGLRASASAERAPGGVVLDLGVAFTEAARENSSRTLEPKVWMISSIPHELEGPHEDERFAEVVRQFALKPFVFHDTLPIRVDEPLDRSASFTTSTFLADDDALWIPIRARGVEGDFAYTLIVRRPQGGANWLSALPPAPNGRERVLVHVSEEQHAGFIRSDGEEEETLEVSLVDPFRSLAVREFGTADPELAMEEVEDRLAGSAEEQDEEAEDDEERGETTVTRLGHDTFLIEAEAQDGITLAERLQACGVAPRTARLRVVVRDGTRVVSDAELPALVGTWTTLRTGLERNRLADWDVDVANDAASANPDFAPWLDGAALDLRLTEVTARSCELEVSGVVQAMTEVPSDLALGSPYTPSLDQVRSHRRIVDDVLVLALEGGAGNATISGSPISVEVSVVLGESVGEEESEFEEGENEAEEAAEGEEEEEWEEENEWDELWEEEAPPVHESHRVLAFELTGWSPFAEQMDVPFDVDATGPLQDPRRIEVRLLQGRTPSKTAEILPLAEADRRIAALGANAVTHLVSAPLWRGADVTAEQLATRWVVRDFETELAHGAVAYDPIPLEHGLGVVGTFTPEADDGAGVQLHWHLRGLADGPERVLHLEPRPLMASPFPDVPVVLDGPIPLFLDTVVTEFFATAGAARIPDGCACWLRGRADTLFGPCEMLFDVRIVGERPEDSAPFQDPAWSDVPFVDTDFAWGVPSYGSPYTFERFDTETDSETDSDDDAESTTVPATYRVSATVSHGDARLAELSGLVLAQRTVKLAGGALFQSLGDWDVDVAGESAVGNPAMVPQLDGAVLEISLFEDDADSVRIHLRGELRRPRALPKETPLDNPRTPVVERTTLDVIELNRDQRLELDADGRATFTVPGRPLSLELRIERLGEEL